MVVTRRTPVVPPAPLGRSHSGQGAQRPPRTSLSHDTSNVLKNTASTEPAVSPAGSSNGHKDHGNGRDNHSEPKSKRSKKHGKNKYRKSNFQAFLDFLTKLLLLAFTVYTFSVCPQDTHQQSPICRGLTEYKRIILDPYIIPPIQAALAHPSIAPHVERARPYVHRAVEITAPIIYRARDEWNLHIVPQWENRIVPEWNKRVVPQWNKHVVPQWERHVTPHIDLVKSKVEPYRLRAVQTYEQRIVPGAHSAFYNLQRWQRQAQPYVVLAVTKTKDGYYAAKPYAIPLAKRTGLALRQFALFLQDQRQKFVDPHVAKMWEKVKELSRGKQAIHEVTPEREPLTSEPVFTVLETAVESETTASFTPTSMPSAAPAYDNFSEQSDIRSVSSSLSEDATATRTPAGEQSTMGEPTFTPVSEPVTYTHTDSEPTVVETPLSTESVIAESLHESPSPSPTSSEATFVEELTASIVSTSSLFTDESVVTPTPTESVSVEDVPSFSMTPVPTPSTVSPVVEESTVPQASATPSKIPVAAASSMAPPSKSGTDDEIDLDAFYAELGLDEPFTSSGGTQESSSAPPTPPTETEEERTERLRLKAEETALKRADVEARQAKWEAELQAQMGRSTVQLQTRLSALRETAAADLSSSVEVRNSIDGLVSEAEKYLKGAEIYLKNLKGESRKTDEKLGLWDRVVERVGDKFSERLLTTEGVVNTWYKIVLDKELEEVATVTAEVREVAEKGQLDLGLDYAWLDDVTYNDWQRYHGLIGTSEQYAHEAASIQNGQHPETVVTNPLMPIFQDLESEVQDVVIGFETRLRRIKRDGERAFNNHGNNSSQKEEGSTVEPESEARPVVSILPVPREDLSQGAPEFVPPVVIGRSQGEVLEALGKVEPLGDGDLPSSSNVDPEEAVSALVREAGSGESVSHTEL